MIRSWTSLAVFVIAVAVAVPCAARAETRTHIVKQSIETLHLSMRPGREVVLSFKAHILGVDLRNRGPLQVEVRRQLGIITLFAPNNTPLERMSARVPIVTRHYSLFIEISPAVGTADVDDAVEIGDTGLVHLCQGRDQRELADEVARAVAERDARHRDELAAMEAQAAAKDAAHERELTARDVEQGERRDRHLLGQVSARLQDKPLLPTPCTRPGAGVMMCSVRLMFMGQSGLLRLTVNNRSAFDAPITRAQVYSETTGDDLVTSTHLAVASQGSDHAAPERSIIGVIPRGGSAVLSIKLRDPDRLGPSFRIVLSGNASVLPAVQPVHLMDRMQLEAEERELKRQRDREAERVSLHVVGTVGAIWFPGNADGFDDMEAASVKGLGIRWTKGLVRMLAVEVDVAGGSSGVASFRSAAGEELTRSARLGRVSFGGVLRVSGTEGAVIPALRAGIGLQVLDQDATLMTGGGPGDAPGAGLEVGMGAYMGGGVDVKLGSNLLLGAGLSFTAVQSNQRILEFGATLAYRWDAHE